MRYEDPYRPIVEYWAIAAWSAGALSLMVSAVVSPFPPGAFVLLVLLCVAMALWRAVPAERLRRRRARLEGHELAFHPLGALREHVRRHPDAIWIGRGFDWSQQQTQLMTEIVRADPTRLAPRESRSQMGDRWIHGLNAAERDLLIPIEHNEGHMLVLGTTGAGKSRLMDNLIAQAILRHETVIVIDPKSDRGLRDAVLDTCRAAGRERDFVFFHPAFPHESARIDPLFNFNRPTELASRIASLIPSETGADPFTAFGMMALNNVVQGLLLTTEKPSIVLLRRFVEGGTESLLLRALRAYFTQHHPGWEAEAAVYVKGADPKNDKEMAEQLTAYYLESFRTRYRASSELEGLINMTRHSREHAQKMLASLMPLLNMLTSGALGPLLSPDASDRDDPRDLTNFTSIITKRKVVVIGLDSLSDSMVGSAIGALLLADLQAVAGARYNSAGALDPVNIYVDECAEVANDPLIALLNKSRGAKFRITVATQTLADWAARFGSEAKARMILGNINNLIAARVIDAPTQKYITENFGKTFVRMLQRSHSSSANTEDPTRFSGSASESLIEREADVVPPALLGALPNLEFFARISGGRVVKGRIPILQKDPVPAP